MFNFKTIICKNCGSVIFNLPEMEAKKLNTHGLICEDCNYEAIKNYCENICLSDFKK